jgi:hypothetical protein
MLITADGNKVLLHYRPFRIDIYQGTQELLMSVNSAGMLKFEHYKQPKAPIVAESVSICVYVSVIGGSDGGCLSSIHIMVSDYRSRFVRVCSG